MTASTATTNIKSSMKVLVPLIVGDVNFSLWNTMKHVGIYSDETS